MGPLRQGYSTTRACHRAVHCEPPTTEHTRCARLAHVVRISLSSTVPGASLAVSSSTWWSHLYGGGPHAVRKALPHRCSSAYLTWTRGESNIFYACFVSSSLGPLVLIKIIRFGRGRILRTTTRASLYILAMRHQEAFHVTLTFSRIFLQPWHNVALSVAHA